MIYLYKLIYIKNFSIKIIINKIVVIIKIIKNNNQKFILKSERNRRNLNNFTSKAHQLLLIQSFN